MIVVSNLFSLQKYNTYLSLQKYINIYLTTFKYKIIRKDAGLPLAFVVRGFISMIRKVTSGATVTDVHLS